MLDDILYISGCSLEVKPDVSYFYLMLGANGYKNMKNQQLKADARLNKGARCLLAKSEYRMCVIKRPSMTRQLSRHAKTLDFEKRAQNWD